MRRGEDADKVNINYGALIVKESKNRFILDLKGDAANERHPALLS